MHARLALAVILCATGSGLLNAQEIVFSHREYATTGRSYQQIWTWSPDAGLRQITSSAHDHLFPSCESGGRAIRFETTADNLTYSHWRVERQSGTETSAPAGTGQPKPHPNPAGTPTACDTETAVLSPDGARIACAVNGIGILIADAKSGATQLSARFEPRYSTGEPYAPWPLESIWAPDSQTLLVGNYGENGGSTTGELDYFLLDLHTRKWTRAFTGTGAVWLAPNVIGFVTPRDLSPLPASTRSVWTAHLMAYDPATHVARAVTSGLSYDLTPASCAP